MIGAPLSPQQRERFLHGSVWFGLAVLYFSRLSFNVADLDIWHEMALIRASLAAGHLSTANGYAYAARLPVAVHHEWGAGAIAYLLAHSLGTSGILAFKYALASGIAWFCTQCARGRGAGLASFSVVAPFGILFAGLAFSPIRGHLYSLFFSALLLWCLERDGRGDRRWIAAWLALFPVWVNLHGGFVVGIGFVSVHALERLAMRQPWAHLAAVAGAMGALVSVNPYGVRYYAVLRQALTIERPAIAEWRPIWQPFPSFYCVAFALSALLALYAVAGARRRRVPGAGILLATAAAACLHARMFPFYALALTCYVPGYLEQSALGARLRASFQRQNLLWQTAWTAGAVFFLFAGVSYRPWQMRVPGAGARDAVVYPVGAVDYLAAEGFRGNVMTPFEYGAYVSWRLWPAARVSVDSRYEAAYPTWWVDQSFRIYNAEPGWQSALRAYPTDLVLVRKTQPLAPAMRQTGWSRVYADGAYEIYARPGLRLPAVEYGGRVLEGRFP